MPDKDDSDSFEFRRCLARIKHLEKVVARYSKIEAWENFNEGDRVMVDNSDSLHDGIVGKFIGHVWSASGYVRLAVEFPDGAKCYYLPTQLASVFDDLQPLTAEDLKPIALTSTPFTFTIEDVALAKESQAIIDAKLSQIAKMPKSARRGILKSSIDAGLLTLALDQAIERGLIDR